MLTISNFNNTGGKHTRYIDKNDIHSIGIFNKYLELLYIKLCWVYESTNFNLLDVILACYQLDLYRYEYESKKQFLKKLDILTYNFRKQSPKFPIKFYKKCLELTKFPKKKNNQNLRQQEFSNTILKLFSLNSSDSKFQCLNSTDLKESQLLRLIWYYDSNPYSIRWSGNIVNFRNCYQDHIPYLCSKIDWPISDHLEGIYLE